MFNNIVELTLHTHIETVSVIFQNEATHKRWVYFCLELNGSISPLSHHLLHFILNLRTNGCGGNEFAVDDILLFPVKSNIRVSHELQGKLSIFTNNKGNEPLGQIRDLFT